MAQPIENYVPQALAVNCKRQAVKVWIISSLLVFAWVFAILLAPLAKANGFENVAAPIYGFFSYICHQISNRSFHVEGEQFAVCSRCFGVYFGLLMGFLVYPLWRKVDEIEPVPRFWLFLSMIPIGIDWSLGVFGIWENTYLSRFITGLILGLACATFLVPGLVEIARNLTLRKRSANVRV
ncbi:MAG TPA: DUF2085 domain-containing protein [Pyrinomonadaceae bacterium]|nr:DUF2085 domain-containing protein [Pyrinomonadaceae bacterium]